MRIRRVVLGASIVGVVGAAVAATVLAIGPQAGSQSVASPGPDTTAASGAVASRTTAPADAATSPDTGPSDTAADTAAPLRPWPPDRDAPHRVDDTAQLETGPAGTQAAALLTETTAVAGALFAFADPATCPPSGRAAVVDRENQRVWLCGEGLVTHEMPMTSAWIQPDPGDYAIYAKDMNSSSRFTGKYSTMTHFVAFTYGKIRGARIAFHSMPVYSDGTYVQPLETLGAPEQRGDSAGCIRVSPVDAELIWSWLEIDDLVRVVS